MIFAVRRITRFVDDQLPKLMGTLLDIEQVLQKNVDEVNIRNGALTTVLLKDGAVTPAKTSGGVARVYSLQYTGDGVANRTIDVGFNARWVRIARQLNADVFEALGSGSAGWTFFKRDSAGVLTANAADFQGIVGTTVKLGSAADGGASNKNTEIYWLEAIG